MTGFYPQGIALHEKLQRLAIKAGQCPLTLAALAVLVLLVLYAEAVYLLVIWLAG